MAIEGGGYFQLQRSGRHDRLYPRRQFQPHGGRHAGQFGRPAADPADSGARWNVTSITIGNDGTVSATISRGKPTPTDLGQIELASFANASGLQSVGGNVLIETAASGAPQVGAAGLDGRGTIKQGALEGSNVNIVEELVDMIETQRAYEVNSKMIKSTDEMLQYVNQQL
jgi:flagellar basal-body rod protein FlgG